MSGVAVGDCEWLGRVGYVEAWEYQRDLARRRALGEVPDTLLLLEHDPVFTTGRRGPGANLRIPEEALGAPLIETDRGGDITFHGPGQLIAYPIVDLRAAGLSVVAYVRALEEATVRTLQTYGIDTHTECGLTGVWAGGMGSSAEKIAAIGVRVGKPAGPSGGWVTTHGLAINVTVDLAWFGRIVPCGISGRGVASIESLTGRQPLLEDVGGALSDALRDVLGRDFRVSGPVDTPRQATPRRGMPTP